MTGAWALITRMARPGRRKPDMVTLTTFVAGVLLLSAPNFASRAADPNATDFVPFILANRLARIGAILVFISVPGTLILTVSALLRFVMKNR